jgi:L-ascorbate metabolism protein UlaG (beta-lactamase superfamily)
MHGRPATDGARIICAHLVPACINLGRACCILGRPATHADAIIAACPRRAHLAQTAENKSQRLAPTIFSASHRPRSAVRFCSLEEPCMADLNGTSITWLGHATVLIATPKGTNILIDPFIAYNPKYPKGHKLPAKIDLLLLTHAHMDHIADALPVAKKHGPHAFGMVELIGYLQSKGLDPEKASGMNIGGSHTPADVTITLTEARHSSSADDGGTIVYCGDPAGFVIEVHGGPVLYHAGDTGVFSDMQLIRDLHHPTLAMLPIGDHYTMGPKAGALAARFLGVKTVLPIHWGTFPALTGTPEALEKELHGTGIEVLHTEPGKELK